MTTVTLTLAWWLFVPVTLSALITGGVAWLWWETRHQPDAQEGVPALVWIAAFLIFVVWALVLWGRWSA